MKAHLTHTGPAAGRTLCGAARAGGELHAVWAPLHRPETRACVCDACLATYLAFAFTGEDERPDWPETPEEVARIMVAIPQVYASDREVADFREWLRARLART